MQLFHMKFFVLARREGVHKSEKANRKMEEERGKSEEEEQTWKRKRDEDSQL